MRTADGYPHLISCARGQNYCVFVDVFSQFHYGFILVCVKCEWKWCISRITVSWNAPFKVVLRSKNHFYFFLGFRNYVSKHSPEIRRDNKSGFLIVLPLKWKRVCLRVGELTTLHNFSTGWEHKLGRRLFSLVERTLPRIKAQRSILT